MNQSKCNQCYAGTESDAKEKVLKTKDIILSWFPLPESGLSPHQYAEAVAAMSSRIGILSGGPGVGKTRTAATIIKAAIARYGAMYVRVCAPTGKAAVRITEAMQRRHIPMEATTIHRMLGVTRGGYDGNGWGFAFNHECQLPVKLVVMDEASMLGTDLAADFFQAIPPDANILLVGDEDQLPPVTHGAVLRDLLRAGFPHGKLTEIWRNEGDIVRACRAIREGKPWKPSPLIDLKAGWNLRHHECRNERQVKSKLSKLLRNTPGINPIDACQVLCIVNEKSLLSRKELNAGLQNILNYNGRRDASHKYRVGDKVICLRNQFLRLIAEDASDLKPDEPQEFVANGDIGKVTEVDSRKIAVRFELPERHCYVAGETLVHDIDLAYAITVHKAQGSQWPIVVYVSDDYRGARWVASRELVYTALSRAEKLTITLGRKDTMDLDCRREVLPQRKTFLVERLQDASCNESVTT